MVISVERCCRSPKNSSEQRDGTIHRSYICMYVYPSISSKRAIDELADRGQFREQWLISRSPWLSWKRHSWHNLLSGRGDSTGAGQPRAAAWARARERASASPVHLLLGEYLAFYVYIILLTFVQPNKAPIPPEKPRELLAPANNTECRGLHDGYAFSFFLSRSFTHTYKRARA